MRSVRSVVAGITLIVTFTAVMAAALPTSADPQQVPLPVETPLPVELPVQVPDLQGLPELPVDVPGVSGLTDILECITGAASDLTSPTGLVAPVQCILEKLLELVSSLLGGLGSAAPGLPVGVPALP